MIGEDGRFGEYFLLPGYIYLSTEPALLSTVLGTNVAVSLWDPQKKYGGMANYLYPMTKSCVTATAQYGNAALRFLIKMFLDEGAKQRDLKAQIFGGADKSAGGCAQIAGENIQIAKKILRSARIEVVSEDLGGSMGRKVVYNTLKNEAIVYKVTDLRNSDWYPYRPGGEREKVRQGA